MPSPLNSAPSIIPATFTTQNFVSFKRNNSPFLPKQKFATPPGTTILPSSTPPAFQTETPSPVPLYTFPAVSTLMPSGTPVSAKAKRRLCARKGEFCLYVTSKA